MTTHSPARTRRLARWAAPVALGAALLTGCASGEPEAEPSTSAALPTPTQISQPDEDQSCTVDLATSEGGDHPDRATITCGETVKEVAGDFRHRVTNAYDAASTGGTERVLVVGGDRRVWMQHPDGSCLITYQDGQAPTACEVPHQDDPAQGRDDTAATDPDRQDA